MIGGRKDQSLFVRHFCCRKVIGGDLGGESRDQLHALPIPRHHCGTMATDPFFFKVWNKEQRTKNKELPKKESVPSWTCTTLKLTLAVQFHLAKPLFLIWGAVSKCQQVRWGEGSLCTGMSSALF